MKKTILVLVAIMLTTTLSAQSWRLQYHSSKPTRNTRSYNNDIYYGLRLGMAISAVSSDAPTLNATGSKTGINVGAALGFELSDQAPVYLETGLYYVAKGGNGKNGEDTDKYKKGSKFSYDLNYLEVPLVLKYSVELDYDLYLQPLAGGYFAYGVGGKFKNYGDRSIDSSFSDDAFKRFDTGLRLGCGLQYQVLYAEAFYEFGLTNICHDYFDKAHTRCFYLNIGVNF